MLTAIDAKLVAYRSKCHFEIVERKISDAAKKRITDVCDKYERDSRIDSWDVSRILIYTV